MFLSGLMPVGQVGGSTSPADVHKRQISLSSFSSVIDGTQYSRFVMAEKL